MIYFRINLNILIKCYIIYKKGEYYVSEKSKGVK